MGEDKLSRKQKEEKLTTALGGIDELLHTIVYMRDAKIIRQNECDYLRKELNQINDNVLTVMLAEAID